MEILSTMVKLILAIAAGFVFRKRGLLDEETDKKMSQLILQLTMPAMVLASASGISPAEASLNQGEVTRLVLTGFLFYAVLTPVAWLLVKLIRIPKHLEGTSVACLAMANTAFMGYPIIAAFLGEEAVFYTAVFHLPFWIWFFTLGTWLFQRDAEPDKPVKLKTFLNPGIVASVLALVLYFAEIRVPTVILDSLSFIGNLTPALSLIVIGSGLAAYSLRDLFRQKSLYWLSLFRLIVLPLLAILFIRPFFDKAIAINVVALSVAMPIASSVAMGTAKYPIQGKFASQAVGLTTLLSMVTIPLWYLVLRSFG